MFYKILFVVIFLSSCFQKEHESKDSRSGSPNDNQIIQQQDDLPPLITDEESNDSHSGTSNNNQTQDNFPPVISGDQNIDFGHQYFNDTYNISNRFLAPELPNGCSIFDETYYVNAVTGNDSNAGTNNQFPVQTINQALTLSSSSLCTLITVSPGTYKEVLTFKYGQKNKTTIFGEDRDNTVLLSKKDLTGWTKLIDQECPDSTPCDIYRKSFNEDLGSTHHMHYKDHLLVPVNVLAKYGFREVAIETDLVSNSLPNDDDGDGHPDLYISEREKLTITGRTNYKNYALKTMMTNANALEYENSVRIKMNDLSFNGIKALFFIHVNTTNEEANGNGSEQSTIYFRALDGELNPENYLSEHIMYSIYISDSEDIVIQNLTIKNGRYNIAVSRNSHNVKVIGNIIEGGYRNVYIFGGVVGASEYHAPSNILVEGNKITNKPALPSNPQHPGHYRNF
ncbi:MAG: hypothetical protein HOJ35_06235, partial [Bdellovibrionales bacterium]|nr:hypothetical protein [Bdellovibrionales bacterium]